MNHARRDTRTEMFAGPAPTHAGVIAGSSCTGILALVGWTFGPTLRPVKVPLWACSGCGALLYDEPRDFDERQRDRPPLMRAARFVGERSGGLSHLDSSVRVRLSVQFPT